MCAGGTCGVGGSVDDDLPAFAVICHSNGLVVCGDVEPSSWISSPYKYQILLPTPSKQKETDNNTHPNHQVDFQIVTSYYNNPKWFSFILIRAIIGSISQHTSCCQLACDFIPVAVKQCTVCQLDHKHQHTHTHRQAILEKKDNKI